ncbi:hypothetical protein C1645_752231 [Glomus cerebriforme]|uniref:DnaJ homologue subfamily C member 28 conserved domain-containing protein n=1 Tax=Glomus cerebriforme TaxID=658196 RepID=A0A397TRF6_9GLOM|nr:hypothetical protein C1645_752231 [Glomus cerebriforme]
MPLNRFFHPTYTYSFTYFDFSNTKILSRNSLLLFRYKSSTTNETKQSIFDQKDNNENNIDNKNNKSSTSINTILKNSFVKENDVPWTGEEDIKTTVLRMLVDKYPPLKIKRNSIKEYIEAHNKVNNSITKANLTPPSPPPIPLNNVVSNKIPKISKKTSEKLSEAKQSRIMNARDAATCYSIEKKLGDTEKNENSKESSGEQPIPKSILGWNNLVENRIQEAIAAGSFKNLPYRGKPLPADPNEQNPYLNRTEFFL